MSRPRSRKLIESKDGALWLVEGNPDEGYDLIAILETALHSTHRRNWQAIAAANQEAQ